MKRKLLLAALLFPFVTLAAQTGDSVKVITNSQMIGLGGTHVLDTYLSDEHFKGFGITYLSHTERQRTGRRWSTILEHEANLSSVKDRANKKQELEGAYNLYWGKLYQWQLMDNRLARAHLNVMPTVAGSYRFCLFNKTLVARYQMSMSLCGIQFSPNYGQSYYEIFSRGNYDHNVVPTTFVSAPEWRQLFTIDAALTKRFTLRIGYLGNMQQSKVNGIRQHIYTHRLLIGFTRTFSITHHAL